MPVPVAQAGSTTGTHTASGSANFQHGGRILRVVVLLEVVLVVLLRLLLLAYY